MSNFCWFYKSIDFVTEFGIVSLQNLQSRHRDVSRNFGEFSLKKPLQIEKIFQKGWGFGTQNSPWIHPWIRPKTLFRLRNRNSHFILNFLNFNQTRHRQQSVKTLVPQKFMLNIFPALGTFHIAEEQKHWWREGELLAHYTILRVPKIEWRNGTMNRPLMDLLRMNLRVKCREGFLSSPPLLLLLYLLAWKLFHDGFWTRQHYYLKKHKNPLYNLFTFINRYFLLPFHSCLPSIIILSLSLL